MKLPSFRQTKILIVGDAMLDRYWHGDTSRISQEAPVPIVLVNEMEDRPGGAANVALNLASLGALATLMSAVGEDEAGNILRTKLESAGVICRFPAGAADRTITKLRILSQNQQLVRADFEDTGDYELDGLMEAAAGEIEGQDAVILADYDKGVLDRADEIIGQAKKHGVPTLVDPKFKDFQLYRGATLIKPNQPELEKAVGSWNSEADMTSKCQALISALQIQALLVTRGSKGMTLFRSDASEVHFPAHSREVYDETGAGDTVIAVVAACLASGESWSDAVELANIAAGIVVGHAGAVGVTEPELERELNVEKKRAVGLMSQEQLKIAVDEARRRGEKIIFTNGCFDILHAGHVDYLSEARSLGDRVIVAVNDDACVTRLKGKGRPIIQLDRRMTMLAALASVDWVVSFSEDTPRNLLRTLKPDVLVKGGDYEVEEVVGADIVKSYQGEVRVLKFVEGYSTSALVEKIRKL